MILGLDFYGVLDKRPLAFIELAEAILKDGEVYIISAVQEPNVERLRRDVERSGVPHTKLIILTYQSFGEVPRLKYQSASEYGVQLFIDDRKDTIKYLEKRGIRGLHTAS